ncbi:hypothetical protein BaRGS_00030553, partial [Batillaria attramentaria]
YPLPRTSLCHKRNSSYTPFNASINKHPDPLRLAQSFMTLVLIAANRTANSHPPFCTC